MPRLTCLIATAFTLITTSCGGGGSTRDLDEIHVTLVDVSFQQAGLLEQEIDLLLRFTNTNPVDIMTRGLSFEMALNDARFADGVSAQPVTLAALSDVTIPVKVRVATTDLIDRLIEMGNGESLDYEFDGQFFLPGQTPNDIEPLPFDGTAAIELPSLRLILQRFGVING